MDRTTLATEHHAPPLRFADVRLTTGVRLRYAEQGDPAGPPIILLHGYSDSWFSFSRVLPLFPARYRIYALDQRGHGDSERPASGYTMRELAADVLAFMDAKGLARATLVGHSMGSMVAQQVALAAPERVARLVLVAPATMNLVHNAAVLELKQAVESLTDPVPAEFAREFQASCVHQPLPTDFMDRVVAESLKLPAHVWRAVMAGLVNADHPARLGDSGIPTLILWGDRDAFFPRAEQDSLAAVLGAAPLKVYPETGHTPHWERPAEFVRDLEEFITRTAAQ
jgi:non-heme chloroperoxidase